MTRFRALTAAALAAGLIFAAGALAQPPNLFPVKGQPKKLIKVQPAAGQPKAVASPEPLAPAGIPVVPKSSAAFLSLKVSDVIDHPDLKPVLEQLKKNPEAFDGVTELFGLTPHEIDRVTLFWPAMSDRGPGEPVVVVTTREAYNEVRLLKALKAEPVFNGDRGRGGPGGFHDHHMIPKNATKTADFPPPIKGPGFPPPVGPPTEPPGKQEDGCTVPIAAAAPVEPIFYEVRGGPFAMLFLVDDRTLVFLADGRGSDFNVMALFGQLLQKKQTGPLADAIAAAGGHTLAGGVSLAPLFREFERGMPRELAPYAAFVAARTGTITGDLGKSAKFTVKLTFDDAAAAKRAGPVMDEGLKALAGKAAEQATMTKDSKRPGDAAMAPLLAAAATGMKNAAVKVDGSTVVATTEIDAGPVAAKAVADLLQSITSQKKFAARANNLKQIGLALHNYHDAMGHLPQNVYGPKGEPLLSWRVQILPYIEQDNLWRAFKMDEPWDSENNKKLIEKMPKVYEVLGREAPKGQTFYQAFLTPNPQRPRAKGVQPFNGRSWLVDGPNNKMNLARIPDGTSNTIGVVEARAGVIWSKPDDIPFGEKLPPLGEEKADVLMVLMLDGSVRTIPTSIKPDTLRILIDGQDGMVTPDDAFDDRPRRPDGGGRGPGESGAKPVPPVVKEPEGPVAVVERAEAAKRLTEAQEMLDATARALLKEKRTLELQTELALRTGELFKKGGATKEEVEKAVAAVAEARAVAAEREKQVAEAESRFRDVKREIDRK
jgi:hypothetical protein